MNEEKKIVQAAGIHAAGLSPTQFILLAKKMYDSGIANSQPLMMLGPPGVGKTDTGKRLARILFGNIEKDKWSTFEDNCIIVSCPLLEPTDIKGIPVPDIKKKLAYWLKPFFLPNKGPGLIFLDDLTAAPYTVCSQLLSFLKDRRVLEYQLPDNVIVIAAGNRVQDRSNCDQLSAAIRSRMTIVEFRADLKEWSAWAIKNDIHLPIVAFLRYHEGTKYFHTTRQEMADTAFPCPRTWANASNIMKLDLPREIKREAVMGCVGVAAGNEFFMFLDLYEKLPKTDDILADPENAPLPTKPDIIHAVCSNLTERAADDSTHHAIHTYAKRLDDEYQLMLVQDCIAKNRAFRISGKLKKDGSMDLGDDMDGFIDKYEPVLRAVKDINAKR